MNKPVIVCEGLSKAYPEGSRLLHVLDNIDLVVRQGERVAIVGSSGSGKTTLLNLMGGLDKPTSGRVLIDDEDIHSLSERKKARLRNQAVGFVYQFHHLLPEFTALENVQMPLLVRGDAVGKASSRAQSLLTRVGLASRMTHKPGELSGGERQRVAIARALVTAPQCVLMDEPTGNLDRGTAEQVQELVLELSETLGLCFVIVTHDLGLAHRAQRVYRLVDQGLVEEGN